MSVFTEASREGWQRIADSLGAKRPSVGKTVKITRGKHKGAEGVVTWHGVDKFRSNAYMTEPQLVMRDMAGRDGFKIRVQPKDGAAFFTQADYAEVQA